MFKFESSSFLSKKLTNKPPEACQAIWQWNGQVPGLSPSIWKTKYWLAPELGGKAPGTTKVSRLVGFSGFLTTPSHSPDPWARMYMLWPWKCIGCDAGVRLL